MVLEKNVTEIVEAHFNTQHDVVISCIQLGVEGYDRLFDEKSDYRQVVIPQVDLPDLIEVLTKMAKRVKI